MSLDQIREGFYRGIVVDNADPLSRMRLLVQIPDVLGDMQEWAVPSNAVEGASIPDVGQEVWVTFEAGNPEYPIWMGTAG